MDHKVLNDIDNILKRQQEYRYHMRNTPIEFRLEKLKKIKKIIVDNTYAIARAIEKDFRKSTMEVKLTEILPLISMLNVLEKKLPKWAKEKKVKTPFLYKGTKSWIRYEGKGNCLIISPWNYPFQLALYPIFTAFAAGNTVICKPSEFTPNTNAIMNKLLSEVFTSEEVYFVEGNQEVASYLLDKPFDHIFFTGSTQVGKIVMEKAAKHLASVGLELGGKSPTVVDRNVNLSEVAKKVVWGKFMNAGQTCVAPDYLLIHEEDRDQFVDLLKSSIKSLYGNSENWIEVKDFNQIVTHKHAQRLNDLLTDAVEKGATIVYGGEYFPDHKILGPTILINVTKDMKLMQEEIFGPILPIITKNSIEDQINFINEFDNALAKYIFSNNKENINKLINYTSNGGVTINECMMAVGHPWLPFGGAGKSGIGRYHGELGFQEFSNIRPIMRRDFDLGTSYFYPPYDKQKNSILFYLFKKFMNWL